jgi:hypothetical protein
MIAQTSRFNHDDDRERASSAATKVMRTSNSTAMMIANDLINCNDNRKRLIATMVMRMIDSGRVDDREQACRLTAMKIARTQQSTSPIVKTFTTASECINHKQEVHVIETVCQLD